MKKLLYTLRFILIGNIKYGLLALLIFVASSLIFAHPASACEVDSQCPDTPGPNECCGDAVCNNKYRGICINNECDLNFNGHVSHIDSCNGYGCSGGSCNAPPQNCGSPHFVRNECIACDLSQSVYQDDCGAYSSGGTQTDVAGCHSWCSGQTQTCGDKYCDPNSENCSNCSLDCGTCEALCNNNKVQDNGETGVDCGGGSCPPCQNNPGGSCNVTAASSLQASIAGSDVSYSWTNGKNYTALYFNVSNSSTTKADGTLSNVNVTNANVTDTNLWGLSQTFHENKVYGPGTYYWQVVSDDPTCRKVSPVASFMIGPDGLSDSCSVQNRSATATISWNAVPNASYYAIRVDDMTNGWNGSCTSPNPGDFCYDTSNTSYTFTATPGVSYGWWVHAIDNVGNWSSSSSGGFVCSLPPITASCTVSPNPVDILTGTAYWTAANVNGGTGLYTYSWSGTGVYGSDWQEAFSYPYLGTYTGAVTVTSGTQSITANCPNLTVQCTAKTPPGNLSPSGIIAAGVQNITWNSVPGATGYYLRVEDQSDGNSNSTCTGSQTPTEVCTGVINQTSYSYNFQAGHSYSIWVHEVVSDPSCYGPQSTVSVTAYPIPTITTCLVSPTPAVVNNPVDWTASAQGGDGSYTYNWTGSGVDSANHNSSQTQTYSLPNTYDGWVSATSAGLTSPIYGCGSVVVNPNSSAWIQINNGDVHSNTQINATGGP